MVQNESEGRSHIVVCACLHSCAISQVCCILLDPTSCRGSALPSIVFIWCSEYFVQLRKCSLMVSDIYRMAFQVNTCSCLFFPGLLFLVTLCSLREEKHYLGAGMIQLLSSRSEKKTNTECCLLHTLRKALLKDRGTGVSDYDLLGRTTESWNDQGWKRPIRLSSPTVHLLSIFSTKSYRSVQHLNVP